MKKILPNQREINILVSYLPKLYEEGFNPIKKWHGGNENKDGSISFPCPEYDEVVVDFFKAASAKCWLDYDYSPEEAAKMLNDDQAIKTADLSQIKTMLTYCVRGERFCDGHWGSLIEEGHIRKLLERLAEISSRNE
jgi:hypothetical protein